MARGIGKGSVDVDPATISLLYNTIQNQWTRRSWSMSLYHKMDGNLDGQQKHPEQG